MKRSKHLKDPLILFLILILTAGVSLAASGDDFGSDADDTETTQSDNTTELRSGFGDDTDDEGAETSSGSDSSTSTNGDDAGTSRDGFGADTDDAEFTQSQRNNISEEDEGTSRDGFGDDTDDEGTSTDGFGDDTDDEGTSRDGFGNESESAEDNSDEGDSSEENQTEDENQTETTDADDGESASYDPADIEIVETSDTGSSVEVQSVDWPNSVRKGSSFQVCAEVSASETPEVTLLKNGVEVDSTSENGNSCFTTTLEQPGDHTLEIRAELDDAQDSETATVNAYTLDSGNDNQVTGDTTDSTSTNNGLIILIILAAVALGSAVIYRLRG